MHHIQLLQEPLLQREGGGREGAPAVRPDAQPVGGRLPHHVQQPDLLHPPGHHCGQLCQDFPHTLKAEYCTVLSSPGPSPKSQLDRG